MLRCVTRLHQSDAWRQLTLSATAMFPLFLLLFGLGDFTKIAVVAFAAWLVIVFSVAYGV